MNIRYGRWKFWFTTLLQVYTPNVDENAGPNTLVTTVVASDKDGDGVTFGFVGGSTTSGLFRIEENTGKSKIGSLIIKWFAFSLSK